MNLNSISDPNPWLRSPHCHKIHSIKVYACFPPKCLDGFQNHQKKASYVEKCEELSNNRVVPEPPPRSAYHVHAIKNFGHNFSNIKHRKHFFASIWSSGTWEACFWWFWKPSRHFGGKQDIIEWILYSILVFIWKASIMQGEAFSPFVRTFKYSSFLYQKLDKWGTIIIY